MPRVLLVCDWFVKYTAGLARGLADLGCEVKLVTRDHDLEFGGEAGAMRAFVERTLDGKAEHLALGGRVRELAAVGDLVRLRRICRRWHPDFVHVQDLLTNDPRLAIAGGAPWRRYALTVHDPRPHPGDAQPARAARSLRRSLRRHAALVFAHSEVLADELIGLGDVRSPVVVVPHGVGEAVTAPLPSREALLFFGRISHYKGLDILLDAMPLVWERRPGVTLTIAGEGEFPDHPGLADPRVELLGGHVPEEAVPRLFESATCVMLPYRQASQSGVGSEAKRYGRAMVATSVGGLPELVTPDSGRLVPPEDARALAEAILEILVTPGLAEALGRGSAAEGTDWRSVATRTLEAYQRYLR